MAIKPGKYDPIKPDIELFDYQSKKRYGLKLEGSSALQVGTISQDDSVHIRNAGKRVGDFDEQRSWKGGRGVENLSSNPEGYWDSNNMWTLTPEHMHPTILWRFARGLRRSEFFMPDKTHSVSWWKLFGSNRHLGMNFTAPLTSFSADFARLWIRRVGSPKTLTLLLHEPGVGIPGSAAKTATVTVDDVTDFISVLHKFDWTGVATLDPAAFASYWLSVEGDADDNNNNHWEIGGYEGGTVGLKSSDGSTWSGSDFDMYYFVGDVDGKRTWHTFFLDGAMYVVDTKDNGTTASNLFINGDRGEATSGAATTLTQSTKAWVTNRWAGAFVRIVFGTGRGQVREIASNTATALTVTVAWETNPSTDSEYIIYGTDYFTEIGTTGLGVVVSQPVVINRIVYFPQGATPMRLMIWNSSTAAHSFSAPGGTLDFIVKTNDATGTRIVGGYAYSLFSAAAPAFSVTPAAATFSAGVPVGEANTNITGMVEKTGTIYAFKEDGVYVTNPQLSYINALQAGMEKIPSPANGRAVIAHQQFVYHSWLHSLIRIYGSSHDDVGQDWSGWGLPDGREGEFSSLDAYTSLLIGGIDAGAGTSSVLGFDGIGWHELLRAYDDNMRIRMVKIQPCQGTRNRLWTDVGGDLVLQEFPYLKGSPRLDAGVRYMHEGVIESAAIDMGTASGLPKFIKELTVLCDNLGDGNEIRVDYQVDDDVHTNNWTEATGLFESPESTAFLGLANIRKFAYRLRIISRNNMLPVDVQGVIPNGYARTPYKMVWTMRCRADNITSKGRLVKPDVLMRWLLDNARHPGRLEMRSQYELAHKFYVIVHPPRMFPFKPAQNGQAEESVFTLVLEES